MNQPGRPILSGNGHPTEWVSAWVDTQLQPLMLSLPTFLKDTSHLLTLLDNHTLTSHSRIIYLDVKSLYTNIPQSEGINSIIEVGHKLMPETDFHTVAVLAELVLKNNIFKFNQKYYIQKEGTAMGTRMAQAYANIFMSSIEEQIIEKVHKIKLWRRFIDDVICTFEEDQEMNVDKLLDISNSINPHIQFTRKDTGGLNTNFLDTNIQIRNNSFIVTPYVKPTDKRLYVLSDSCHPTHQKTSIAYSQSLRRICTCIEDSNTHTDLLKSALERRGYTAPNIDTAIEKARCLNRSELIQPSSARKNPDDHKTLYFVTTFHPGLKNIRDIVLKHTSPLDPELKVTISLTKCQNLGDILVRAKLPCTETQEPKKYDLRIHPPTYDLDRDYCVSCHPLSSGKALLTYTRKPISTTPRFIWNCKQIHNKFVIFCNICQEPEIYTKLCSPHDFIKSLRNGTADTKPHPHTRDILNITIYPVWASHTITISCTKCSYKVTNQINRMPETVSYEIRATIHALKLLRYRTTHNTITPHCNFCEKFGTQNIIHNSKTIYGSTPDCSRKDVIYVIICQSCNKPYIGQTSQELKLRLQQHIRDIKNNKDNSSVAKHFNDTCTAHSWHFCILDREVDKFERPVKEMSWIFLLQTENPEIGLNIPCEAHYTLNLSARTVYKHIQHSKTCREHIEYKVV